MDSHGLSDVNWAAVAFDIVADHKLELLWPKLLKEEGFWWGDMPTQIVSKPLAYEKWESKKSCPPASIHSTIWRRWGGRGISKLSPAGA